MDMGAAAADAGVGESAWGISGWVRALGNLSAERSLELVPSEAEPDRRNAAEDRSGKASAGACLGVAAFGGGEPGESLWMEAALACIPLSVESLPDGSHR